MNEKKNLDLRRVAVLVLAVYALLVVLLYFLAGDALRLRQSLGTVAMPTAESAALELIEGEQIEQTFAAPIQRLTAVSVQWGTYASEHNGTVTMALYLGDTLLGQQIFDAAQIADGAVTTLSFDPPLETVWNQPITLRLTSDCQTGSALYPLMNTNSVEGYSLELNGAATEGTLCFAADGEDYIWTGRHYWKFAAGFGVLLALYLYWSYKRWQKGKAGLLVNTILAVDKYSFLIKQLVSRDFKAKYKRSVLGVFWSFLNPLLNMAVQYVVFSNLFRFDTPFYPVYLLCGNVMFNYFSESCGMSLTSITGNASLITKVYVPKYIYPLTRILSSLINLLIAMIPLIAVALISGLPLRPSYLLSLYSFVCLAMFCLGLGMLLAAAMVFFRDVQFLWGVLTTIWMYATPIFYPVDILPQSLMTLMKFNPLYHFITFVRTCIISGVSPEPIAYVQCLFFALLALTVGALVFKKTQDNFVLYL